MTNILQKGLIVIGLKKYAETVETETIQALGQRST